MPNEKSNFSLRSTKSSRAPDLEQTSGTDAQEESPPEQDSQKSKTSAGKVLTDARIHAGLSQADVAAQMNLLTSTIQALEQDDLHSLPEPPYVHHYLRTYAKIVNLAPRHVVRMYNKQCRTEFGYFSQPFSKRGRTSVILWRVGAVLVIAAGLFGLWKGYLALQSSQLEENSGTAADRTGQASTHIKEGAGGAISGAGITEGEALAEKSVQAGENDAEEGLAGEFSESVGSGEALGDILVAEDVQVEEDAQIVEDEPVEEDLTGNVVEPVTSEGDSVGASLEDEPAVTVEGQETILLTFTEGCWVEIRDADSKLLVLDLFGPGMTREVRGKAPFDVLLGNSHGVRLEVNGENFDHSGFARSNRVALFQVSSDLSD